MDLISFRAEHAVSIMAHGLQLNEGHDWSAQAGIMEKTGDCITVMDVDVPVLAVGIVPIWDGCGEAWLLGSNEMSVRRPVTLARILYDTFYEWVEHKELWRVQANVRADWPLAIRFARFIGMEREGLMKKFGPEQADYFRYAWVA